MDTEEFENLDEITKEFVKEIYKEQKHNKVDFADMQLSDFETYIKNKNERTSTSPSGRHLGHFKVTQEHPIQQITFHIIVASLRAQYIPTRWRNTVTALIEKEAGSLKIHRLQTIHIVEPEVQFISNFYWSKKFLQYCELQENNVTDNQYGGRKRRWAHTASAKTQVLWDILKLQNIPAVTHVADARANFDRNMFHVVGKLLETRQFPDISNKWYKDFLRLQEFFVRTAYGVSNKSYHRDENNRIFGDCQGLAWSAINQIIVSSAQDNIYRRKAAKFSVSDYTEEIYLDSGTNYFIDDRVTVTILDKGKPLSDLLPTAQRNEEIQQQLINAAGGALAPGKCFIYVMVRKYGSITLGYKTDKELPGTLHLRSTGQTEIFPLDRYHPKISKRYLGSFIEPMMEPKATEQKILELIKRWKGHVEPSFLRPDNVIQSLYGTLYKQIEWPLAGSDLLYSQCENLMGKIRPIMLRKQHLHTKTRTEVVHGPGMLAGIDMPPFFNIQGQAKLNLIQRHLSPTVKKDTFKDALMISFADHMMWIGKFGNFLNLPYKKYGVLLPRTYLGSTWKYVDHSELQVDIADLPSYTLPRHNDKYITDVLLECKVPLKDRLMFNRICLDQHVISLSDLVMENGFSIHPGYLKRNTKTYRESTFKWQRPEEKYPDKWVNTFYNIMNNIIQPYVHKRHHRLGIWTGNLHQRITSHKIDDDHVRIDRNIFVQTKTGLYEVDREATQEELEVENPIDISEISDEKVQLPWVRQPRKQVYDTTHIPRKYPEVAKWKREIWGHYELTEEIIKKLLLYLQYPHIIATDGGNPHEKTYGTYGYVIAKNAGDQDAEFLLSLSPLPCGLLAI